MIAVKVVSMETAATVVGVLAVACLVSWLHGSRRLHRREAAFVRVDRARVMCELTLLRATQELETFYTLAGLDHAKRPRDLSTESIVASMRLAETTRTAYENASGLVPPGPARDETIIRLKLVVSLSRVLAGTLTDLKTYRRNYEIAQDVYGDILKEPA